MTRQSGHAEAVISIAVIVATTALIVFGGLGRTYCDRHPGASCVIGGAMEIARCPR